MIYQGQEITGDFEFMCGNNRIDEFTIFANVIERDEYFVTVARYQNFGKLRISDVTLSRWEFNDSYNQIEADALEDE